MQDVEERIDPAVAPPAYRAGEPVFTYPTPRRYTRRPRKEYAPPVPRAALGALAAVMVALTMGAFVLLPIALESVAHTLL